MRDQIIETMSNMDNFTYEDEPIEMAKERLDHYLEELSELQNSLEDDRQIEQFYCLEHVLKIIETIKKEL